MIYIKQLKLANICSKNTVSSADASYYVYIDASGNLVFGINGAERAVARGLQINTWYRISCVYDDKPPKWIQNSEWPIIEGKPLVFLKQVDDPENNSRTLYYFYDSETKTETVVEQFD